MGMFMRLSAFILLRDRERYWSRVAQGDWTLRDMVSLGLFVMVSCGAYGMVLAGARSWELSLYVAVKLPVLFMATTLMVSVFNWMLALILGAGMNYRTTLLMALTSMTLAGWILLGLIPVVVLFVGTGMVYVGPHHVLRYAHNSMLVTHILVLAAAGTAGNLVLLGGLKRLLPARCPAEPLFVFWLCSYAFVGCQLAWILRPFVGSPFYDVAFLRPDCLDRNFYEFVFREVMPYLINGG